MVNIDAQIADFAILDNTTRFTFHTAKDGYGPYHIHVPNTADYVFFEADVSIGVIGKPSFRFPTAFMDSLQLESNVS